MLDAGLMTSKLEKQLNFIIEIDKVKSILRKTTLFHEDRVENDAEHSWTICMMALILQEYSDVVIDVDRVVKMLLIHDIVEIDVGDVYLYDVNRAATKEKESVA
ncbi:MAG: HD domain-containing protein, partial [Turicibacter sp.]|nr:HD domain-containing protein [Turicibacter sp.]